MLKVSSHEPANSRRLSPLSEAIETHRIARAAWAADTDGEKLGADMDDAEEAIIGAPCASDAEFVQKLAYLLDVLKQRWGCGPGGGDFDEIAIATEDYLSGHNVA